MTTTGNFHLYLLVSGRKLMINTETAGSEYPPLVALISATPLQTRSTHCHLMWGNCRALHKAAILFLHLRMRMGFSLEKFVSSLVRRWRRERDTFYFLSIPWEECLSPDQPEGPGSHLPCKCSEMNLGGGAHCSVPGTWKLILCQLLLCLRTHLYPPHPPNSTPRHLICVFDHICLREGRCGKRKNV